MWACFLLLLVAVAHGPTFTRAEIQNEGQNLLVDVDTPDKQIEADLDFDRKKKPKPKKKKPSKKPVKKPAKKPAGEKPTKPKPAKKPSKKPAKKPGMKPSKKPGKKPAKKPAGEKPTNPKPAKKPAKKPGKKPSKKPAKKPGKKPGKKPTSKPGSSGTGEAACEGHNYDATKCSTIGCCQYEDGQCWSAVGASACSSGEGSGEGGPLDGPSGPTTSGQKCTAKVTFPKKTSPVSKYPLFTTVFGIGVMGSGISDTKFQHIASMLAQLIDNDADGCPDSPEIVTWLNKQKVVQWFGPGSDSGNNRPDGEAIEAAGYTVGGALLFDQEVNPNCAGTAQTNQCSDASLEEIWHVITGQGYEKAFPKIFSSNSNSKSTLANAMDVARGGHFTSIPKPYPSSAWYKYDDATCTYKCQAVEYIYWGVASYMGALVGRTDTIPEFKFNTKEKLVAGDKLMTALIQDTTKYRLPTVAPDGKYRGCSTCSTGVNHGGN